ncbi:MAG: DinB family protein [Marmoricola sp.]
MSGSPIDRQAIHDELELARATFSKLVLNAEPVDLRRASEGTRWDNRQLLFHMLFGYMIVRALLPIVRRFGRLPDRYSRVYAAILNAATSPFHVVNYLGSCVGALVFRGPRLIVRFDRTIASLHLHLDEETEGALLRSMHFPVGWDPYFADRMSLADVYRYGTQHFDFHQRQLTLTRSS